MSRTLRLRGWPGARTRIARRAQQHGQPPPGCPAGNTRSADTWPADQPSSWRIVNVPYRTWMAALDRWQLTRANGELRRGPSLPRDPAPVRRRRITIAPRPPHTVQLCIHCRHRPAGFWVSATGDQTARRPWCLTCCQQLDPASYHLDPFDGHHGTTRHP
jgi:hypothetical protein